MLMRNNRSVRSLIAAAGLVVGVHAATPALAQTSGSAAAGATLGMGSAEQTLNRAADLLSQGKAVQAQAAVMPLVQGDSVGMSDSERARALTLLSNINQRIKRMNSFEVSLDTAEVCIARNDLKVAQRHAEAVIASPKATNEQSARAREIVELCRTRRAELAAQVPGSIEHARQAIADGDVAAARASLEFVSRVGGELTPEQAETVDSLKLQVVGASDNGSMGMLQPGVVKPGRPRPKPSSPEAEPAPAAPVPAAPAPAQPTEKPAATAPAKPAEVKPAEVKPAEVKPAQPAATAPATTAKPAETKPAAATAAAKPAETKPVEVKPAAQEQPKAAAPAPAAQPDLIDQARRLEAADLITQADQAFEAGRMADAAPKYDRILRNYSQYLDAAAKSHVEQRLSESRVRLNQAGGNLLEDVERNRILQKQQIEAEITNSLAAANRAIEGADVTTARDAAAAANLTLNSGRRHLSDPEFQAYAKQISDLRGKIDLSEEQIREKNRLETEQRLKGEADEAAKRAATERQNKINEAIARVRALQMEMKYEEALQVVDQILFLDPINPTGLVLRDVLSETILAIKANSYLTRNEKGYANQSLENIDALNAPPHILDYPEDWPRISSMRGEPIAFADSPENRRALAVLESKRVPVPFNDTPFSSVVDFVKAVTQLNVDVDWQSLEAVGIDKDAQVTLNLTNVSMRTVLDRVVEKISPDPYSGAAWSIDDGVLTIASREVINKKKELVIYDIRDLLIEIPDYTDAPTFDLQSVLQNTGQGGGGGQSPFREENQQREPRRGIDERTRDIIDIITTNVDPQGWQENGGDVGFIQQLQGSMIITNTPANHRAIHGLLQKLREVRALQINVETRFLLVAQDFFEQIGFDIDVYFNTDNNQVRAARATAPNFRPSQWFPGGGPPQVWPIINPNVPATPAVTRPSPLSVIGAPQNSLNLSEGLIEGGKFASDILGVGPAMGVAGQFLDDLQVDFLVKATQADRRTVNLTAPRLTFTNGQTSNIYVATQVAFVSDLTPVVSESAVGFDPELGTINEGVTLLVSGTISADRRYVTLDVDAATSKINGFVNTPVTAVAGGQLVNSAQTSSYIQQPTVTVTRVRTTVTIPDQGTILLGGQRLVTEAEIETGVPVLSKLPLLGRFFSNRIETKEEATLLILLKPTILIQNEEEERSFPGLSDSTRMPFGG